MFSRAVWSSSFPCFQPVSGFLLYLKKKLRLLTQDSVISVIWLLPRHPSSSSFILVFLEFFFFHFSDCIPCSLSHFSHWPCSAWNKLFLCLCFGDYYISFRSQISRPEAFPNSLERPSFFHPFLPVSKLMLLVLCSLSAMFYTYASKYKCISFT